MTGMPLTVGDGVRMWLEVQRGRVREPTWFDYTEKARYYVIPTLGQVPLESLGTRQLVRLYQGMMARGLSHRTVRYTHQILHHTLQHAVSLGLIGSNPAAAARPAGGSPSPPRSLTPAELARFLRVARTSQLAALWLLLAATGMRPTEALALRWDDLDLARGRARVLRSLRVLPGGRFQQLTLRSASLRREVTLPKRVREALSAHRTRQRRLRRAAAHQWEDHGLVFTSPTGRPLRWGTLMQSQLKSLFQRAGLPPVTGYSLRHACVAALLERGVDFQTVSRQTGYARLGTLLDARQLLNGRKEHEAEDSGLRPQG